MLSFIRPILALWSKSSLSIEHTSVLFVSRNIVEYGPTRPDVWKQSTCSYIVSWATTIVYTVYVCSVYVYHVRMLCVCLFFICLGCWLCIWNCRLSGLWAGITYAATRNQVHCHEKWTSSKFTHSIAFKLKLSCQPTNRSTKLLTPLCMMYKAKIILMQKNSVYFHWFQASYAASAIGYLTRR